jgi:hypothetical protein
MTNILQKEDSIPVLQGMGLHIVLEPPSVVTDHVLGVLLPDGKPNLELGEWKTIPQGAATCVKLSQSVARSDRA